MKVSSKLIAGVVLCAGLVQVASAVNIKVNKLDPNMELYYAVIPEGQTNQTPKYKKLTKNVISVKSKKRSDIYFRPDGQKVGSYVTVEGKSGEIFINEAGVPSLVRP